MTIHVHAMEASDTILPEFMPDADGYYIAGSAVGEPVTMPAWLSWVELVLFVSAVALAAALLIRRRDLRSLFLFAGIAMMAVYQVYALLSVVFTHSEVAFKLLGPGLRFVLWSRWAGPFFLAAYALLLLVRKDRCDTSDHSPS
jgi:hypothetical protein